MKPLPLDEICKVVNGRGEFLNASAHVGGVTIDTRTCSRGDLYFAIRGKRLDGHQFLPQAAQTGCIAAVIDRDAKVEPGIAEAFGAGIIRCHDTTQALGALAAYHRSLIAATVVAVTGSNGKTTTKRLIHHILSKRLRGTCSPKSFNNNIGVPLTLLAASPEDQYVVCEVGTNAPGEIAELGSLCRPDIAVITSIGETHLEKLGSLERVATEKASLLGCMREGGLGVVWADSELLLRAARAHGGRYVTFGMSSDSELRLTACEPRGQGMVFEVNGRFRGELPLSGRHNACNALAAIAVARRMGISCEDAAAALADFSSGAEMRLEWLHIGSVSVINDAFNANPASMEAAADVLVQSRASRAVLVAGDMLELGEQAAALHERTGRRAAQRGVDLVIGVGALGRYIAQGAAGAGASSQWFESVEQAGERLPELLCDGDVVLIKGSRGMKMERLIEPLRRCAARQGAG
jgi:UDP-N-acetylmuramoyl-tripeptide--D-alanyl-D-alanine ligase